MDSEVATGACSTSLHTTVRGATLNYTRRETVRSAISKDDLTNLALRLVRCPSEQTDLFEQDPQVKRFVTDTVAAELAARGLDQVLFDEMGNLVCRVGRSNGRSLLFLAYAMTHPASSMHNPFAGEIVQLEGRDAVRGRGIAEQKGSLAAMIAATDAVNRQIDDLDGELILAVSLAGETGRHDSVDTIRRFAGIDSDIGIVGIGTNGAICQGNKGRVDVLITVQGISCHSSSPGEGINAIEGACRVIQTLQELQPRGEHPKLGRATLACTSIKSFPDATHTIQNECRITLDRRLLPGQTAVEAIAEIRQTLGDMPPFGIEVQAGAVTLPSEVPDESPVVELLGEAITAVRGMEATRFYSSGAIDAGFLNANGIAAVMFGPGTMTCWHTSEEVLLVDELLEGAQIYASLAVNYLSGK